MSTTFKYDAEMAWAVDQLARLGMNDSSRDTELAIKIHNVIERNRSNNLTALREAIDQVMSNVSAARSGIERKALDGVGGPFEGKSKMMQMTMEAAVEAMHSAKSNIGDGSFLPHAPYDPDHPPLSELAQSVACLTKLVGRPEFDTDTSIAMALESVKSIMMKRIKSVSAATDHMSVSPGPSASDVESMIDNALAKQEERHQKAIRALLEGEKIDTLVQVKIDYALIQQNEEHDRVVQNLEHRHQQELRELRIQLAADLAQQHERHQLDLKVVRHDILDLEHSILQVKSAPPPKAGFSTKPVDDVSPRASLASRGSMWGHKLSDIPPVKAAIPPYTNKFVYPGAPAGPAAGKRGVSQPIVIDITGSDDDETTVSAISDDDICILEPTEAEALLKSSTKLAKGSSKPPIKTSSFSTGHPASQSGEPAPQSPTFDNTGPLAVSPSQLNRLMRAALLLNAVDGRALVSRLERERPDKAQDPTFVPFELFMAEYYKNVKGGVKHHIAGKDAIWRQLRAIMSEPMQAGSSGKATRPPLWEGCGPQGIGGERK